MMMSSGRDQYICVTLASGHTVTSVDRRGIIRGPCYVCQDCDRYEVQSGLGCEYCGCPPGKHKHMGTFNQIVKAGEPRTTVQVDGMQSAIHNNVTPASSSQFQSPASSSHYQSPAETHQSLPRIITGPPTEQQFNNNQSANPSRESLPASVRESSLEIPSTDPGHGLKGRKSLTLEDMSTLLESLPGNWTTEDAMKYLDLQRAQSVESVNRHCSSPQLNVLGREESGAGRSSVSTRSEFSDFGSTAGLGPYHRAYDRSRPPSPTTPTTQQVSQNHDTVQSEDGDAFERESPSEFGSGSRTTEYAGLSTTRSLTFRQNSQEEEKCKIVALNGGDVIRGTLKEGITLKVDIFPRSIKKQHVMWYHNNTKISPRYRVRFVNDRREIHILSLRKKDAGVYMCQIKYMDGKQTKREECKMILTVDVPVYVAADL